MMDHPLVFALQLAGLLGIAAGMQRHAADLLGRRSTPRLRGALRLSGWIMLIAAYAVACVHHASGMALVIWLGWFVASGIAVIALIDRAKPRRNRRG